LDYLSQDLISVCVCTFKRPSLLLKLLNALRDQSTHNLFSFEVVVVDNDALRSAEEVVRCVSHDAQISFRYSCEPERSISLTRNRAIRCAMGNLIAFIDDDECPDQSWLYRLRETYEASQADAVMAPVLPEFPPEAPPWLSKAGVFRRRRFQTGTRIGPDDARTGNVLINRALFVDGETWFDPAFGRTGGEDSDFFLRQSRKGRVFVWCDEAVVYEAVPEDRWKPSFHLKRLFRSGTSSGEWIRQRRLPRTDLLRSTAGLCVYGAAAPVALILPMHLRMRFAQKLVYYAGVVSGYSGLAATRNRD